MPPGEATKAWLLGWVLLVGACGEPTSASVVPSVDEPSEAVDAGEAGEPERASPPAELVSVKPGINDRYYKDGAVEAWTKTLEAETREVAAERAAIVAALELKPGMVVADVGAGTGLFLADLSAGVGPSGKLYALDIAPAFLEHLRERAAAQGLSNVEVVAATPTDAKLPAASVDLLFVCDVYHHVEYPSVYLPTLRAALRPGGRMVVVDFERVPGKTSAAMLKHVRADKQTVIAEIEAAGFVLERELGPSEGIELDENYMLVFRRKDAP